MRRVGAGKAYSGMHVFSRLRFALSSKTGKLDALTRSRVEGDHNHNLCRPQMKHSWLKMKFCAKSRFEE